MDVIDKKVVRSIILNGIIIVGLILISLMSYQTLILVPVLYAILFILRYPVDSATSMLMFLLPFASIIKLSPQAISFSTIFELIYILRFMKNRQIKEKSLFFLIIYFVYIFIVCIAHGNIPVYTLIGVALPMILFLSIISTTTKQTYFYCGISYAIGMLLSSICGLMTSLIPRINDYVLSSLTEKTRDIVLSGSKMQRYYGLLGDSNIQGMYISVAFSFVTVMFMSKKISTSTWCLLGLPLLMFGLLTISKTYLILTAILFICCILYSLNKANKKRVVALSVILLLVGLASWNALGLSNILDKYIFRFTEVIGSNVIYVDKLTTYRSDIWLIYLESMFNSVHWLFGYGFLGGLTTSLAAHNTYIQSLYINGIIGELLLIYIVFRHIKLSEKRLNISSKATFLGLIPTMIFMINLFSLDTFTWDSFYIILSQCVLIFMSRDVV